MKNWHPISFPAEFQKNYTYVSDKSSAQSIIDGVAFRQHVDRNGRPHRLA